MTVTADRPRFSVVIPVRDDAARLPRAVRSVLGQSADDLEVVVVDDGSTDGTPEVARSIDDPRVRYHRQEAAGVSAARNSGIALAHGEWIVFLDSDDEALPGWLESFSAAGGPATGVVCAGVVLTGGADGEETEVLPSPGGELFHGRDVLFLAGSFAARRELVDEIGGYTVDLAYSENTDLGIHLVARCAARGLDVASIDRPLVRYFVRPTPTGEHAEAIDRKRLHAVRHLLSEHADRFQRDRSNRGSHLALAGVLAARLGAMSEARRYFRAALATRPDQPIHYARCLASHVPGLARRIWRHGAR
ncbi:MAG TPA: glycosyltransferase family A protein [Thermoanaerobaculia bacterium]|jgi:glycosyltransferase involved in cell wall biosynthesis|nr:glycosyltransferase family A protein [Thermoanaerobaculia bacterium]